MRTQYLPRCLLPSSRPALTRSFSLRPTIRSARRCRMLQPTRLMQQAARSSALSASRKNNPDFSSFILQATASKAKVLWLISAAEDTTTALKQAKEFGVAEGGQHIVVPLTYISNVHALGIEAVQGLTFTTPFYWNRTP